MAKSVTTMFCSERVSVLFIVFLIFLYLLNNLSLRLFKLRSDVICLYVPYICQNVKLFCTNNVYLRLLKYI